MKRQVSFSLHVPSWRRIISHSLQSMKVLLLLSLFTTASIVHATVSVIGAEDPLQIHVDETSLHSQILYTGLDGQVYPSYSIPGAFGTFLLTNGVMNGSIPPAGFSIGEVINYTPISQTIAGNGTGNAPYKITTIVDIGTSGLRLEQVDNYVSGNEYYATTITLTNSTNADINATLYRAMDCYLAGFDNGYTMLLDPVMGSVACTQNLNNDPPALIEALTPLTIADNYITDGYSVVWHTLGTHEPLPNTILAENPYDSFDTTFDNGQAISWDITVPAGETVVRSHLTNFSPTGNVIADADGDGISDEDDNCPTAVNPNQVDSDNDGIGNTCETDVIIDSTGDNDGDTINNDVDNCIIVYNPDQANVDGDDAGDACDAFPIDASETLDTDSDGVGDNSDNCPSAANGKININSQFCGGIAGISCSTGYTCIDDPNDSCDPQNGGADCGGVCSSSSDVNLSQKDSDGDGIGDACDTDAESVDTDNDSIANNVDNCPDVANANQLDTDNDGIGDACDTDNENVDTDGDNIADNVDNCLNTVNTDQIDMDDDGIGDACDDSVDSDNDGVVNSSDNCPATFNIDQSDSDNNGIGDACDIKEGLSPIYHFWSALNRVRFFTISKAERDYIIATYPTKHWEYIGVKYYAYSKVDTPPEGTSPVYRFWFKQSKAHFFTINEAEKDFIIANYPEENLKYGGIAWYAYKASDAPEGTIPVYRFYSALNKTHFFTADESEKDYIIATHPEENWKYSGIAWYAYK